ncbi:GM26423, partial [Drosophila sechellia]
NRLDCQTREENSFVLEHSVDLFVKINLPMWSKLELLNINPLELLDQGTEETFATLSNILSTHDNPLADENVLPAFISRLGKLKVRETQAILKYAVQNLSSEEYEKCVVNVLEKNTFLLGAMDCEDYIKAPSSFVIKRMLQGETTTGDARIERAFEQISDTGAMDRVQFIQYAKNSTGLDISFICDDLLRMNNDLSKKKPRYFANCKEHRMKMRIGKALLDLSDRWKWSDNLWEAALCPSDQPNISFMYEYLVSKMLPSIDPLLEHLKLLATLKPSQQISLVSVVHIYCLTRWESINHEQLAEVFDVLLPLTMGANFQTRLLAQLVLHRLCSECEVHSIQMPIADVLKKSIEVTLSEKLTEFQCEARLLLPQLGKQCPTSVSDCILMMTNAPFDENICFFSCSYDFRMKLKRALETLKRKQSVLIPELTSSLAALNGNVQRKMNPVGDIYPESDFVVSSKARDEHELIVVASLIDKLPNLGGLARTCEVLGVNTLILGLKSQAEKSDFTNLSMTAEKTLNILEVNPESLAGFLLEKQMEGYKIVGAEQTAHSTNFVDFKFPKKSILLLGHEKHGIPANLIGFLDYAVEIPQYGLVRSLNVHVAGSLFIWEYCKQHLTKN